MLGRQAAQSRADPASLEQQHHHQQQVQPTCEPHWPDDARHQHGQLLGLVPDGLPCGLAAAVAGAAPEQGLVLDHEGHGDEAGAPGLVPAAAPEQGLVLDHEGHGDGAGLVPAAGESLALPDCSS